MNILFYINETMNALVYWEAFNNQQKHTLRLA